MPHAESVVTRFTRLREAASRTKNDVTYLKAQPQTSHDNYGRPKPKGGTNRASGVQKPGRGAEKSQQRQGRRQARRHAAGGWLRLSSLAQWTFGELDSQLRALTTSLLN